MAPKMMRPADMAVSSGAAINPVRVHHHDTPFIRPRQYPDYVSMDVLLDRRLYWIREYRYARVMHDEARNRWAGAILKLYERRIERVNRWMDETAPQSAMIGG